MNKDNLNAIRILGIEAINKANSGHPGIVLDAAPMCYALFVNQMIINPKNPKWINRDRFILSAGHGSALLYSILHLSGFNVSINDLKNFRQIGSITPGHPEFGITDGVEATTGPLGQGFAMGVGMALAESHLSEKYNKDNFKIIDHYTYVLCGDGDLQEGVCQEAISFAGRYKLNKLIVLHDSNDIQLDAKVSEAQSENMIKKFEAANWNTIRVNDGEDIDAINEAINEAKKQDKPTYIEVKTIIGFASTNQGTTKVHGAPLGNDIQNVKDKLNWKYNSFEIPQSIYDFYETNVSKKGQKCNDDWNDLFAKYKLEYPDLANELEMYINKNWKINIDELFSLNKNTTQATRVSSGETFNYISSKIKAFIGGSADLSESTKIKGPDGNYDYNNKLGRNIMYGVREFAMSAINNGIALHGGLYPIESGFFVFSDYMKPAIRLSALMGIQKLMVFTHDSIAVGEDGPTHQPIEQLAMLRSIPNISVYRPCDMTETIASYYDAICNNKNKPSIILATRQNLEELKHKDISRVVEDVNRGAYVLEEDTNSTITLIATGSEVSLALKVKEILNNNNKKVKLISMVNMNLFLKQDKEYIESIIDTKTKRYSIELSSTFGWHKFLGDDGFAFGIDTFGHSAPFNHVLDHINFDPITIANKILDMNK
ncbi:transketolase [Spiroplasma turonicum]|uniref:Transketolase n=1 Tax=Spiroplasma turonicum TaxID=216946 RepID=A0A0K1P613_9MOLU|nr:transketolase [Spiroplasma turonicum]AKU79741.1 transketolase [Spiroplasma turonicum]ALX70759.1 transketolase [Spiroplasma turonicum]